MNKRENCILTDVGGFKLNSILVSPKSSIAIKTVLFIHGASTSLLDPFYSFESMCPENVQLLFVDRPGHGQSEFGPIENIRPDAQADAIAKLMQMRGIEKAIVVGHSYGGAVAAAMAVRHPKSVEALIFLSPAVYHWVGGTSWYNRVAVIPIVGLLFSVFVAPIAGWLSLKTAIKSVFYPGKLPIDYITRTKAWQALRPRAFRRNARELNVLSKWAENASQKYEEITMPTIIVTGDKDNIVSPDVHAKQLSKDIKKSELFIIKGLGHKSDYFAKDFVMSAIGKFSGQDINLVFAAKQIEHQISVNMKN